MNTKNIKNKRRFERPKKRRSPTPSSDHNRSGTAKASSASAGPGLAARQIAVNSVHDVMVRGRSFDGAITQAFASAEGQALESRDRALARLIAVTVLRRHGDLAAVLNTFLGKPLAGDRGKVWPILLTGAAQLLLLDVPPHAAISLSVDTSRLEPSASRFDKLVNAILRRTSETGRDILASLKGAERNIPDWMFAAWVAAYGEAQAQAVAAASLQEPALDLTVIGDPAHWAAQLNGIVLNTNSVRARVSGRIEDLPGFDEGQWWVQDAAAALPVKLFGDVKGQRIADLCAAPGGKTLQLAALGAKVTAVDSAMTRLDRLKENLKRTHLSADIVASDVFDWIPDAKFDGVLLDAPCTATGTIRRHPDILHLKRSSDVAALAKIQKSLLDRAATFVAPGGVLIYCTCSMQPEEGIVQVHQFLERHNDFHRAPIESGEAGIRAEWLTPDGDLRTLPHLLPLDADAMSGLDGFYAARLRRKS